MAKYSFIIVANRLPITVTKKDGVLTYTPSSGGLATAMSSVEAGGLRLWVGWPGINAEDLTSAEKVKVTKELERHGCLPIFLTAAQVTKFYEGYSNETIWPLFHYFQSAAQFRDEHWQEYKQVNELFAAAVLAHASSRATVWVHDYHFMLLPKLIRDGLQRTSIGFFLHIPFPSFEVFRLLPQRQEILEGLMGADLVGFHIYDYALHFSASVMHTLGYELRNGAIIYNGRTVRADAFPIGIDYAKFEKAARSSRTVREVDKLSKLYQGKKIILSVDRLDYTKGIPNRLEAFERFLEECPQYHKKVSLVMVAVPSRIEVNAYQNLREQVEKTVSRINGAYGSVDWSPISYQFQSQTFDKLVALYTKADIALVTPVRDGMNLVAKEYVACKQTSPGVLILSELAGAVDELPEALVVNPNDQTSIVQAIKTALEMPTKERRSRTTAMQRRISSYHVQRWAEDFLEQLRQSKLQQGQRMAKLLKTAERKSILNRFSKATHRLLLFDYDGTLHPYINSPKTEDAIPSNKVVHMLTKLARQPNTTVCIVSGRTKDALEQWFHDTPLVLVAEHGYWVRYDNKWMRALVSVKEMKQRALPIMRRYCERTPGSSLEEKHISLVWHYRNVPPELAYVRQANLKHDLDKALLGTDTSTFNGNKILEVRPENVSKGGFIEALRSQHDYDFVMCIGDDSTDEDMFEVLLDDPQSYTFRVGLGTTLAKYQLLDIESVTRMIEALE